MPYGWRIASPDFSRDHAQILSGEGSFLYGGRWNSKGTRVVYLGSSLAQASMELLVHLGRAEVLKRYMVTRLKFDEALMEHIDLDDLPDDWQAPIMAPSVQAVGDQWVEESTSLVLEVPSAAINGEYNILLNPAHPDFDKLVLEPITPFSFDPRLLK